MQALLLLALVALNAHATDLSWTCTSVTAPADVVAWRMSGEELGAAQAGQDAFDALYAYVDTECLADCPMPFVHDCPERTCITAAGDLVTWSTEVTESWGHSGEVVSSVAAAHLVVEPALDAGVGWTRAEVTRARSDLTTGWRVAWEGVFDPRWPVDGAFEAAVTDPASATRGEWWSDRTCNWSSETGFDTEGWRVDMNGESVFVTAPDSVRLCGRSSAELGGVPATLDGVSLGLVDVDSWLPLTGTDADGDHWLAEYGDCDDTDPTVNCEARDIAYDGIDQDCAGGDNVDADHDGARGDDGTDCDDGAITIHPGATDYPGDGVDQDCDGTDGTDADGDGYLATLPGRRERPSDDCDDADPSVYPGAPETWRDGIDQDCDGFDGTRAHDADRDRWADEEDCAPEDASVHPGVAEAMDEDGVDSNCDGVDGPDTDHDGVADGADCARQDASIHPGATDTPEDGIDQDCDGVDATATGDTSGDTSEPPYGCGCVTAGRRSPGAWGGGGPAPLRNASPGVLLASVLVGVILRARRTASRGVRTRRVVA